MEDKKPVIVWEGTVLGSFAGVSYRHYKGRVVWDPHRLALFVEGSKSFDKMEQPIWERMTSDFETSVLKAAMSERLRGPIVEKV